MSSCYIINKTHGDVEGGTICKNKKRKIYDCDRKYVTNNLFDQNFAISISDGLAKYLLSFSKEQRLKIYESDFYDRIIALQRNEKCVTLIEGVRHVVKIIDRIETKTETRFIVETNEKKLHEIRLSAIIKVIDVNAGQESIANGIYLLSEEHKDLEIGTILFVENNVLQTLPRNIPIVNDGNLSQKLILLDKLEAQFLLKISVKDRMEYYRTNYFKLICESENGDDCQLKNDKDENFTYTIIQKNIGHSGLKFVLASKCKNDTIEVDECEIILQQTASETSRKQSQINSGQYFGDQTNDLNLTCNSENLENFLIYPRERNRNLCLPSPYHCSKCEISLKSDKEMINSISSEDSSTSTENESEKVFPDIDINSHTRKLIPARKRVSNIFGIVPWPRSDINEDDFDEIELNKKDTCSHTAIREDRPLVGRNNDQDIGTHMESIFGDHILPSLDFIRNLYLANNAIPDNIVIVSDDNYSSNDLVTFVDKIPIHGRIKFVAESQNNRLLGINIVSDMTGILNEMSQTLTNRLFDNDINGVIIRIEMACKFNQGLKTFGGCPLIDITSVQTFEKHKSDRFQINDVIKYLVDQRFHYDKIIRFVLLNDVPCLELESLMFADDDKSVSYLREEHAYLVDDIQLETQYFDDVIIDPSSVVTFENIYAGEWMIGDEIYFYLQGLNRIFKANLRWIGKVNGIKSAAVEVDNDSTTDDILPYQCSQTILNQIMVQSGPVIVMVKTCEIYKDCRLFEQCEIMNKYFLDLLRLAKNRDIEGQIILDLVKMKNQKLFVSILNCDDFSINLDNHKELLPLLIKEEKFYLIKLVLQKCHTSDQTSQILLHLASVALKIEDEDLFSIAMGKCVDNNALFENGETFLTNLFKENSNEMFVNDVIGRELFNRNQVNRFNESPFMLACQNVMISTMKALARNASILSLHENDVDKLLLLVRNKLSDENATDGEDQMAMINRLLDHITIISSVDCQICQNKQIKIAFGCDHLSCESCYIDLKSCPLCGCQIEHARDILII